MTTYTVTAERSGRWWALQCTEVPGALSQVARLDQADQIKEAIAFIAGVPEDSVDIDLVVKLPDAARQHLDQARALREQAQAANTRSAEEARAAAKALHSAGFTTRDIGSVMGVSFQRAHQLMHG